MLSRSRPLDVEDVCHAASLTDALLALRSSRTRWLVANGKGFGDAEAVKLARALQQNKYLEQLSLAGNKIGPIGAEALGESVGTHSCLKEIYLQRNRLGQEGIDLFAAAVQSGGASCLQVINAASNGIGRKFPPGLALPTLKSLILKNNIIEELPSCYGECEQLSDVVLDNNPLISPQAELYESQGWLAIRPFLINTLNGEKAQNRSAGLGMVSNHRRDLALLGPVRKLLARGALHDAAIALEKARGAYVRLKATSEVSVCDGLATRMLAVLRMDGQGSGTTPLDCCFRTEERGVSGEFLMSREVVGAKAPFLSSQLCDDGGDEVVVADGRVQHRKAVTVAGASRGGLRCFLAYLLLDDLRQAVAISARLENITLPDNQSDDDDDDDDDDDAAPAVMADEVPLKLLGDEKCRVGVEVLVLGGGGVLAVASGEEPEEVTATAGERRRAPGASAQAEGEEEAGGEEEAAGGAAEEEGDAGVSGEVLVLLEAVALGERFGVAGMGGSAQRTLRQLLRPTTVVGALRAAHRRGNAALKGECLRYLEENAERVGAGEWAALRGDSSLLLDAMAALGEGDSRPPSPRWRVCSWMMQEAVRRIENAERRAQQQADLIRRTEASLQSLKLLLAAAASTPPPPHEPLLRNAPEAPRHALAAPEVQHCGPGVA